MTLSLYEFHSAKMVAKPNYRDSEENRPSHGELAQATHLCAAGDGDATLMAADTWQVQRTDQRIVFYAGTPHELHRYDSNNCTHPCKNRDGAKFNYVVFANTQSESVVVEQYVVKEAVVFQRPLQRFENALDAQNVLKPLQAIPPVNTTIPNYYPHPKDGASWWRVKMENWFKTLTEINKATGTHQSTLKYWVKEDRIPAFIKAKTIIVPRTVLELIAMNNKRKR